MIYRIDVQHFLTHAIDHFTKDELEHFQYAIISAAIRNGGRSTNVAKINELYPTPEMVITYNECKDKKILEKMYFELLDPPKNPQKGDNWASNVIYKVFINPLNLHHDIVILCDRTENDYIDILCKYLKKNFHIEVIDLNELFSKGKVGPIYIDRAEIWNNAVDIRKQAAIDMSRELDSTRDGRLAQLRIWSKKQKLNKLKEIGISTSGIDKKDIDKILIDEWVDDINEED